MKQVLITREQLNRIFREVNSDIAADFATKRDDIIIGMLLTVHAQNVLSNVCDILFGKEESNAEKTGCKEDPHAQD